jgi:hypothetical protein
VKELKKGWKELQVELSEARAGKESLRGNKKRSTT